MLTVEQVRELGEKVHKALELIDSLKSENSVLRDKLGGYEQKIEMLQSKIDEFRDSQAEVEEGIKDVLGQLGSLEDRIPSSTSGEQGASQLAENSESNSIPAIDNPVENKAETEHQSNLWNSHSEQEPHSEQGSHPEQETHLEQEAHYEQESVSSEKYKREDSEADAAPELEIF